MIRLLALLALALWWPSAAEAAPQSSGSVITTCGTLVTSYLAGRDGPLTVDTNGELCISGTITATNPSVVATGGAVPGSATYVAGNKSGNLVGLILDGSSNLDVNCMVGCAGGTFNNNADAVATSATNGQNASWLYAYNGATFDRLRVDASKNLNINISAASATNISTNEAQINGVTPLMGNGVTGTGSQRVTIASDNTAFGVNAAQSGTWNITNVSGTISLPTLAATSTKQSDGTQKTQVVDGSGNVIASTSNNLNVQCANCSGSGASAADEASITFGSSVFAPAGGAFQTTATSNALTNGQQGMVQMTAQRAFFTNLRNASGTEVGTTAVPLQVSLANTGANATAVLVNQPTAASLNATVVGTGTFAVQAAQSGTWTVTGAGGTFPITGATSNASSAIATSSTNVPGVSYTYGFNGTTWDQLQVDASKFLKVTVAAALPAGSAVIGHVIADTGSTTAVTGNVTVVQPTGTNLHAVLDTTSTTAVTQATAANLNATVVGTGTFATQSAITAASGSVASGAVASGAFASGSVSDGAVVTLGAKADAKSTATDTTAITIMQVLKEISAMAQAPAALPANQSVNVAQIAGSAISTAATGVQKVGVVGSSGAVLDAAGANQSAPANELITGGIYQVTPAAISGGNVSQLQLDARGNLRGTLMDAAGNARGANVNASNQLTTVDAASSATGSAPPANAVYLGAKGSSNLTGMTMCDSSATYDASTNGSTQIVAGVSAKKIYICGFLVTTGGTATNVKLVEGTGANCVTGPTNVTAAFQLAANDKVGVNSPFWNGLVTATNADALCINASAGNAVQALVFYTVQ